MTGRNVLFLLFQLGQDRYALDATQIADVLPLVNMTRIPHMPANVAGVFNHRGSAVPTVDLSQLLLGRPAQQRLSTRIVLVRYPNSSGAAHLLGLIAERATQTLRRGATDFSPSGLTSDAAAYLGPVASDAHGLVQRVEVHKLLSATLREALFRASAA